MEDLETIKNRIEGNYQSRKTAIYKLMMGILIISSLGLGFLIYAQSDPSASALNRMLGTNINFNSLNADISKFLERMFNFNILNDKQDDQLVSDEIAYIPLGDDRYTTTSTSISMLKKGIISHIESDNDSYFIVISYQDNVLASYFDVYDPLVKKGDQLEQGNIFGTYMESFKVIFTKNGQKISYEEVLS